MIHVLPVNDLREHVETVDCWCGPSVDDGVCVHNAMDEREKFESGQRLPC
jgi:hypothetical protein